MGPDALNKLNDEGIIKTPSEGIGNTVCGCNAIINGQLVKGWGHTDQRRSLNDGNGVGAKRLGRIKEADGTTDDQQWLARCVLILEDLPSGERQRLSLPGLQKGKN